MKIALLDDWQENAHEFADWARVQKDHQLDIYHDTIEGDALIQRLQAYDVLCLMRERTLFSADLINALPNLKAIITSGMRNAAIDLDACKKRRIVVSGTASPGHATAELAMILIGAMARQIIPSANSMRQGSWAFRGASGRLRPSFWHAGASVVTKSYPRACSRTGGYL